MIDLAPHNPYGLVLESPVIVAPGCAAPLHDIDPAQVGAIVTRPAVRRTPQGGRNRWGTTPAGVVFERLPTIKLRGLLELEAKRWSRSSVPVLLCLKGTADELSEMTSALELIDVLAGLILDVQTAEAAISVTAVRDQTALPLLVIVPDNQMQLAAECATAGADALIVQGYPRATAVAEGEPFEGVLVGPALAPRTLMALRAAAETSVPLIALGGVADVQIAQQCLAVGATALMVDGAMYGDPLAPQRIGMALNERPRAH